MDFFNYKNNELCAEQVSLSAIANRFGTPTYVYSRATLERHWHAFDDAFANYPHLICYAVKACSNIAILNLFARLGSGFDVVSGGELARVIAAKGDPQKVVFSGVAKSVDDIRFALSKSILSFNVESLPELERINDIARSEGRIAPISIRINPDVDAKTHPYIATGLSENKFGIDIDTARHIYNNTDQWAHCEFTGIDCHIGSQLTELAPFLDALDRLLDFANQLKLPIKHLDLGGGLGVNYQDENPPHPSEQAKAIREKLGDSQVKIILEPGRAIAANAGVLITRVEYLKENQQHHFAIVDAGMNDLLRPALYSAWQAIIPVTPRDDGFEHYYDVVGPVCETGDFIGKRRLLNLKANDLLAVRGAGAYGFCMSSQYNTRPRAAEVLVDNDKIFEIRARETVDSLFESEKCLP